MEQSQLAVRVKNKLQLLMREIQNEEEVDYFNDLLIINRIVPKLPLDCLRNLIRLLKPILDETITTPQHINLTPIYQLLCTAKIQDPLLADFLTSSGYTPCLAWPSYTKLSHIKPINHYTLSSNGTLFLSSALPSLFSKVNVFCTNGHAPVLKVHWPYSFISYASDPSSPNLLRSSIALRRSLWTHQDSYS